MPGFVGRLLADRLPGRGLGKEGGVGGDRQFRIYVRLKPDARETLERSREFKRGADNTIYHNGYPLSHRQQGGVPSIQISTSASCPGSRCPWRTQPTTATARTMPRCEGLRGRRLSL